jgi:hypothetical protein
MSALLVARARARAGTVRSTSDRTGTGLLPQAPTRSLRRSSCQVDSRPVDESATRQPRGAGHYWGQAGRENTAIQHPCHYRSTGPAIGIRLRMPVTHRPCNGSLAADGIHAGALAHLGERSGSGLHRRGGAPARYGGNRAGTPAKGAGSGATTAHCGWYAPRSASSRSSASPGSPRSSRSTPRSTRRSAPPRDARPSAR